MNRSVWVGALLILRGGINMPKYIANAYLLHNGSVVQTGGEVELTKEQAERLGDKVSPVKEAPKKEPKSKKDK